jgi:acyl carrier protein/GNAT superfamily N-acetyltransferase
LSRDAVEQEITRIVRDELLLGTERPIPRDKALGEVGVGLDSLALVNLLAAIEADFGVDLPDDIWTARAPLSLNDLVDVVATTPRTVAPALPADRVSPVQHGPMERVEFALGRRGLAGRAAWAAVRFAAPAARFLLSGARHLVLERSLDDVTSPWFAAPSGIDLRPYRPGDEAGLSGLWPPYHERGSRVVLERSLREGAIALVAVEGSRIVALDLLSRTGDDDVNVVRPDACYGFALAEARSVRGRGIGVALIAYSFRVALERGLRAQLTYVWQGNAPMLAAATQLLGFRPIGTARRMRVLGVTRWSWEVDGERGRGRRLQL